MANATQNNDRTRNVRAMFSRIASNYDRMNRLMTAGMDARWRREGIRVAKLQPGMRVLDLGSGTGDLARLARKKVPGISVTAADFTLAMMLAGKKQGELLFVGVDALATPFADASFDVVVSGFLLRNTVDLDQALSEQYRLLKPGGRAVVLDTTRPTRNLFSPFIWLHMHVIIPTLGWLVSGDRKAYAYLTDSSEQFLLAEELADRMQKAGFMDVEFKRHMAGTIAIHWGFKGA
jgi:demethylmenaquinone methyltransferase/2-methoxy-6-polyprenyl-1,4-benzoquinol methylase